MTTNRKGLALTLISTVGIIVLVVSLFVYTMTQPRVMTVKELVNNGAITYEQPIEIQPFSLIDHNQQSFNRERFQDHWTLLFFGFSHCGGFCPTTLALLDQVQQQLEPGIAKQTQIVMVSVDPERDTPERLHTYMTGFNPNFIGVTGDMTTVHQLSKQLFISFQMSHAMAEGEHYDVPHGEQIVLINPKSQYQGFFKPPFTLARLKTTYQSIVISYQRNQ